MFAKRHGKQKLFWRKTASSRVYIFSSRLPQEEESTLQFYNDFANSLTKAEVRPESTREQKEAAMNEYNSIAFNYEDQGDSVTAAYFYQKVIELAVSCKVTDDLSRINNLNLQLS